MNDARFDDWTRRRFGLLAGGGLVALLVAGHPDDAAGRNRKRKRKRTRRRRQKPTCPGAGRPCDETDPDCCPGLECGFNPGIDAAVCCRPDGARCTPETACCSTHCDAETETCTQCQGRACGPDDPCCALHECEDGFCGGCVERGAVCVIPNRPCCPEAGECADVGPFRLCGGCLRHPTGIPQCFLGDEQIPCCETDCTGGACLSAQGRPCEFDKDCLACDEDVAKCPGACHPDTKTCTV